jgi:hypothetical protein
MLGEPGAERRRLQEVIAIFGEKGATSPERAMTAQELGLPPRFEEVMKWHLVRRGLFVKVGGKYYMDEARLQKLEVKWGTRAGDVTEEGRASIRKIAALRMVRLVVGIAALTLAVASILFVQNTSLRLVALGLFVAWIAMTVFQMYRVSRVRRSRLAASRTASGSPE